MGEIFIRQLREALLIVVLVSAPPLGIALCVGLLINILQAVTQIQEQTLSYVPKILSVFFVLMILLPWMIAQVARFAVTLFQLIPIV